MRDNHRRNRLFIRQAIPAAAALLGVAILVSGCFVDRSGTGLPPSEFEVVPAYICPLDPISVRWDVWASDPCWTSSPASDGRPRCSTVNSPMSGNPETPFSVGRDERSGTRNYDPGPSVDTTFSMTTVLFGRRTTASEDLTASVDVIEVPTAITETAPGLCGDNGAIELAGLLSSCVEINQICVASTNPPGDRFVLTGRRECAPGTPPDACLASTFTSDALRAGECISPADVGWGTFEGLAFVDIDLQRDPLSPGSLDPRPGDCTLEGSGYNLDLYVTFQTSCTGAYAGCAAAGMGGGGAPTQPPPTASGAQSIPSGVATEEATPVKDQGICAENGGVQYEGEVCVCAGFVDQVTICKDGVKIDTVTGVQCTPDPNQCNQGNGPKPNDDKPTCEKSCGNDLCQAECGENPNNCPADC